jgi:predicted PurR-regulated permease PerM
MGIATELRKQANRIAIEAAPRSSSWVETLRAAAEQMDAASQTPDEKDGLDLLSAWAVIGIFLMLAIAGIYMMSIILIPVTLAIVVGMILGLVAERLAKLGVPRVLNALLLSSSVALFLFLVISSLGGPLATLAQEGPGVAQRALDRIVAFLQTFRWLHVTPQSFESGPIQIGALLENTGNVLHVVTNSLTPALFQGLIFFAALLFFLVGRAQLRKAIIMAFQTRPQRLAAIRIINAVEQVLGFYFATASAIFAGLGVIMTLIAFFGGLPMPVLWGIFAFFACFIPFFGITAITISVAIGGILTHDTFLLGIVPAAVFFAVHLLTENVVFPAIMGRQLEINPFVVFLAIVFWTWMWGPIGAMLALPLSLVAMAVINELFIEEKTVPQLPK